MTTIVLAGHPLQEGGDFNYNRPVFSCHLVDPITAGTNTKRLIALVKNIFVPCIDVGRAGASQHPDSKFAQVMEYATPAVLFYGWILMMACIPAADFDISAIAWSLYIGYVVQLSPVIQLSVSLFLVSRSFSPTFPSPVSDVSVAAPAMVVCGMSSELP